MDFPSLEIFCAVAAEQSITRAARQLARVQSNVTARVKQLEDELQVPLFSRQGRRMTLTPSGRTMLAYAERLLSLADEAREAMIADEPAGLLRIGTLESIAAARLPAMLAGYHSRFPQVELEIAIGTSCSLVDDVADGRADCAFVADAGCGDPRGFVGALAARGLAAMRVWTEALLLVLPPGHPAVKGPQELEVATLAAFSDGCTYRGVLERWLDAGVAGQAPHWNLMELTSYHTMLACIAAGSCFALVPKSVLDAQAAPLAVRTQAIATADTFLVARSGYSSGAYEALRRSVEARIRVAPRGGDR